MSGRSSKLLNSDKEVNAFKFNMKEQRCLSKSLSILDSEASYAVKLLDLDSRGIKVFYKRFKDKVSRIKSKLSAEEIADMKRLEDRGIIKLPTTPVNLSGALRIADAEKRLKIDRNYGKNANNRKSLSANRLSRQNSKLRSSVDSFNDGSSNIRSLRRSSTSAPPSVDFRTSLSNTPLHSRTNSISNHKPAGISSDQEAGLVASLNAFRKTTNGHLKTSLSSLNGGGSAGDKASHDQVDGNSATTHQSSEFLVNSVRSLVKKVRDKSAFNKALAHDKPSSSIGNGKMHIKNVHVKIDEDPSTIVGGATHVNGSVKKQKYENLAVPKIGDEKLRLVPHSGSILHNNFVNGSDHDGSMKHVTILEEDETEGKSDITGIHRRNFSRLSNMTKMSSATSTNNYSCHNPQEKNSTGPPVSRLDLFSRIDDDDTLLSGYLGEDPYEERRKTFIKEEQVTSTDILDRKDDFMGRLETYITEQESHNKSDPTDYTVVSDAVVAEARREASVRAKETRLKKMQQRMHRNSLTEDERRRRVTEQMKDVNKCRYLRVPSEKIDLSGIVTLACEQMKLFKGLKMGDA